MARSEARLHFDIWDGLEDVSADAKLLYCVILSDRSVNHAGQGFTRIDRWEKKSGLPLERVEKAMNELEREPHIAFDRTTGEFLIRTLIRKDDYADQPYLLKGALAVAKNIESKHLRRILAEELRKLPPKKPDGMSKAGKRVVYPDPHACATEIDPGNPGPQGPRGQATSEGLVETLSDGSAEGVETHLSLAPEPRRRTPSRKGFETQGGGGSGGGSGSGPVVEVDPIKASPRASAPTPARERLDVRAARLIGTALPRGIGRGARGELTAAVQRRLDEAVPDEVVLAALSRWVSNSTASARAIEWMLDDAIKESHGASPTRRGNRTTTDDIFAKGSSLVAQYEAEEAAGAGYAVVHPIARGVS